LLRTKRFAFACLLHAVQEYSLLQLEIVINGHFQLNGRKMDTVASSPATSIAQRKKIVLPRWQALILVLVIWPTAIPLVHGVLPWGLSFLTPRLGWTEGSPGLWNLCGIVLIFAATGGFIWALALHVVQLPERVVLELTPTYLLRRGPYAFTRNPMYLAVLALWLGWTLFYGSPVILLGSGASWLLMNFLVRREECALETRFGASFIAYKNSVPRWLGRRRL
jgi:protein-S-isoprenylcysteine O-methyltransferase Ste14